MPWVLNVSLRIKLSQHLINPKTYFSNLHYSILAALHDD